MEFIESERGNQKLNIKLKKNCGNYPRGAIVLGRQLSGGVLSGGYCPAGNCPGAIVLLPQLLLSSANNSPKIRVLSRVTCKLAIIGPRPVYRNCIFHI